MKIFLTNDETGGHKKEFYRFRNTPFYFQSAAALLVRLTNKVNLKFIYDKHTIKKDR